MIRGLSREQLDCGVVAASAGNHAQAVAFAAREAGARAVLVMPEQAPLAKVAAVRQYGGEVRFVDGGYDEAQAEARRLAEARGLHGGACLRPARGGGRAGHDRARDRAPGARREARGRAAGRRRPRQRHRACARERAGGRARGGRPGRGVRALHRLAGRAPADRRAVGEHDLRRHRGEAPGRLHAAAGAALRGRGRDRLRRRGRPGDGPAAGAHRSWWWRARAPWRSRR